MSLCRFRSLILLLHGVVSDPLTYKFEDHDDGECKI